VRQAASSSRRTCETAGSFIMGTSVALEIKTDNGTVTFLGTLNRDRSEIRGAYTVSGGSCAFCAVWL
jgi:hypothetical protein